MAKYGVNVPRGVPVFALDQVDAAVKQMVNDSGEVVVKSQILAGGRGLGTFKNGFKGGVHIVKAADAKNVASKMLGQVWVGGGGGGGMCCWVHVAGDVYGVIVVGGSLCGYTQTHHTHIIHTPHRPSSQSKPAQQASPSMYCTLQKR